jgi:hypothetical protein
MVVVQSRLNQNILDVFNAHGVQIMTPADGGDPVKPKTVPPQWDSGLMTRPAPSSAALGSA